MKLAEYGNDLNGLGERLNDFRIKQQSLKFCLDVWRDYAGGKATNEHMDERKALDQLLHAIDLMVKL